MKFQNVVRKVQCQRCEAKQDESCRNKQSGVPIKGIHRERQLLAYAEGFIVQNTNPNAISPWSLS